MSKTKSQDGEKVLLEIKDLPLVLARIIVAYAQATIKGELSRELKCADKELINLSWGLDVSNGLLAFTHWVEGAAYVVKMSDFSLQYKIGSFSTPSGLIILNNTIYIVEHGDQRMSTYDLETGKLLNHFNNASLHSSVSLTLSGNELIVGGVSSTIHMLDTSGNLLRKIDGEGVGFDPGAFHFSCVADNKLYVTDWRKGQVFVFSLRESKFLFKFPQSSLMQPAGLVVIGDELYVAAHQPFMSVFSLSGELLRSWGSDGSSYSPRSMIHVGDELMIADYGRGILMFK